MKIFKPLVTSVLLLVTALTTGCGGGMSEVTGTVTFDGQTTSGLEVRFEPIDPTIGTTAIGYTQEDGSYRLHYPGDKTGAPAGEYTVHITGGETDEESGERARIAARFNSQSELKATVTSGDNVFNFEVTSE